MFCSKFSLLFELERKCKFWATVDIWLNRCFIVIIFRHCPLPLVSLSFLYVFIIIHLFSTIIMKSSICCVQKFYLQVPSHSNVYKHFIWMMEWKMTRNITAMTAENIKKNSRMIQEVECIINLSQNVIKTMFAICWTAETHRKTIESR